MGDRDLLRPCSVFSHTMPLVPVSITGIQSTQNGVALQDKHLPREKEVFLSLIVVVVAKYHFDY